MYLFELTIAAAIMSILAMSATTSAGAVLKDAHHSSYGKYAETLKELGDEIDGPTRARQP